MITVKVEFSGEEHAKLRALAELRNMTIGEVLRAFARAVQPGGSGWVHPAEPLPKKDAPPKSAATPALAALPDPEAVKREQEKLKAKVTAAGTELQKKSGPFELVRVDGETAKRLGVMMKKGNDKR